MQVRVARMNGLDAANASQVLAYLPENYAVIVAAGEVLIVGVDVAGWTLDGYVIPRLASGLYFAEEVK